MSAPLRKEQPLAPQLEILKPDHAMYPRETNQDGTTKHSRHCKAAFGRKDWSCFRCCELMVNAKPRVSWHSEYFRRKLNQAQRRLF